VALGPGPASNEHSRDGLVYSIDGLDRLSDADTLTQRDLENSWVHFEFFEAQNGGGGDKDRSRSPSLEPQHRLCRR